MCFAEGAAVFDASQYAFFGEELLEEVELGGLEDDDVEEDNFPAVELEEEEEFLFGRQEVHTFYFYFFYFESLFLMYVLD